MAATDETDPEADAMQEAAHAHLEEAAQPIAQLHAEHHRSATPHQRGIDRLTGLLGRPWFIGVLGVAIFGWIAFNTLVDRPFDPAPFPGLAAALSVGSLGVMLLILATQRREDELVQKHEQLTLQLALLNERKAAKIIDLLEELRRDLPLVHDRVDEQAEALAQPADPQRALKAIADTHAEAELASRKPARRASAMQP